ncbi:multicopper oxidase 1 [Musca autumnalis]|uniref:multicopper oxidase 1 n=1 Tax=Musca autumnalis TaxID=221902 RepID=UPI003CF885CF
MSVIKQRNHCNQKCLKYLSTTNNGVNGWMSVQRKMISWKDLWLLVVFMLLVVVGTQSHVVGAATLLANATTTTTTLTSLNNAKSSSSSSPLPLTLASVSSAAAPAASMASPLSISTAVPEIVTPLTTLENETNIAIITNNLCNVTIDTAKAFKTLGSIWINPDDPCSLYKCELNKLGTPHVVAKKDNCGEFYCDIDSEVRPKNGTCCGECVRTKCRFDNQVYEIGSTWHNNVDCTLLECGQLPNGEPIINAYQKTCPELPKNCPADLIYVENCCQYCREARQAPPVASVDVENEDIWTEEYYRNHPCARECKVGEAPRTCHYTFVVEWYETLSKACYDCPKNVSDCTRPHCIAGDGITRSVTVVNRMMPGPQIEVCLNDTIVVDVKNHLLGESTTIHWHGLHMKNTPYMDGVPHVTQCPISPHSTFRYTFWADNVGTHFWHSHTGMQRGDGVFGALIIKRPRNEDPHGHLYDFDLSEHTMIVQDWVHVPGVSMFASHHHSNGDNKPLNLLLNGKGRYYKAIWQAIKANSRSVSVDEVKETLGNATTEKPLGKLGDPIKSSPITITETPLETNETEYNPNPPLDNDVVLLHPSNDPSINKLRIQQNEISRTARLAKATNETKEELTKEEEEKQDEVITHIPQNPKVRHLSKRALDGEIPLDFIPLQQYNVTQGFRYRFRVINAEFLNCPIQISIDNHTLTAISSDGYDFEALEVGSIVTYAGERFDFIVNANQAVGNYWIRLKGLMDCDERFTSAFQVGILHYDKAPQTEPQGDLGYQHQPQGIELNAMNQGSGHIDSLTIAEVNGLPVYDRIPGIDRDALKPVADYKFFVYYDFYRKDNPEFHPQQYYGMGANLSNSNLVFTPQLNHISMKFPAVALLAERNNVDDSLFCNETSLLEQGIDCRKEFCKCHHVLQVPRNAIVEFIIIDEGVTYDANHPFHLHGNAFRVVGMERLAANVTVEMIKELDRFNLLKRNLVRPPVKDTVTVPDGGYTIVRFEAYNPGFWLFHCHIEFHAEIGMALILKVGDNDEMLPVPKRFPTCHDYVPQSMDDEKDIDENTPTTPASMAGSENAGTMKRISWHAISIAIVLIITLVK